MKDNNQQESQPLAEGPEVSSELSKIASNPKRNIAIVAVAGIVFAYLVYQIIKGDPAPPNPAATPVVAAPSAVYKPPPANSSEDNRGLPAIPELPKLTAPVAPPPPPPPEPTSQVSAPEVTSAPPALSVASNNMSAALPSFAGDSEEAKKRAEAKRKSSVVLIGGKETVKTAEEVQQMKDFTKRGDMSYVLGKGKILEAVLESAVNTDIGGEVRALIVRDVYAEDGNLILISKGSKVFGTYAAGQKGSTARIEITWARIDLPSGYSLNFTADTIDSLGRKGVEGRLDNKYKEQFTNAVLTSAFNVALAGALDKIIPPPVTSQTLAQNTALTTQINTAMANAISQGGTPIQQVTNICAAVQPLVPTTSTASYNAIVNACNTALAGPQAGATPESVLTSLQTAITNATANVSQTTAAATTPTQAQAASQQAFKDITGKVQDMMNQNEFKPTVTLDQGKPVKIYVNKDYVFPKAAVSRSRIIK